MSSRQVFPAVVAALGHQTSVPVDPSRGPPFPHRHFAATRAPRTWRDLPDVRRRRRTVKVVLLRQTPSLEVHTTVLQQAVLARAAWTC